MNYLGWNSSVNGNLFYLGWLPEITGIETIITIESSTPKRKVKSTTTSVCMRRTTPRVTVK